MEILQKIDEILNKKPISNENFYRDFLNIFIQTDFTQGVCKLANLYKITTDDVTKKVFEDLTNLLDGKINPFIGKSMYLEHSSRVNDGAKVEQEHTNFWSIAKLIANDHISECPDYYSHLAKMEKSCKS